MSESSDTGGAISGESSGPAPARSHKWMKYGVGPAVGVGAGGGAGVGAIFGDPGVGAAVGAAIGVVVGAWIAGRRKRSAC